MKGRDRSTIIGKAQGENAARALRLIHKHHDGKGDTYVDRLAPPMRDAVEARQRSVGAVVAPPPPPAPVDCIEVLGAMLADLGELGAALSQAAAGDAVRLPALREVSDTARRRWESIRDALGDSHALTRRARTFQVYTAVLASDWIPSLVIAHKQAERGLPE